MKLIQRIKELEGITLHDEDGETHVLHFRSPLSHEALGRLEKSLPCPMPDEIRELLSITRGFVNGPLGGIDFSGGPGGFEFLEIFPCALSITGTGDGCGNFWVVDLTKGSTNWGPIYFACHDPPVIAYQASDILEFVEQWLRLGNQDGSSTLGRTLDNAVMKIWRENPGVISYEVAARSSDRELKSFAENLEDSFLFADLRRAVVGDGFSWGRFGPRTVVRRHGEKALFACQKPPPKKTLLKRLFGG